MQFSRPKYWIGSLSLSQGIFPTHGSNPGLPHCRQILYQLSHTGRPRILEWVAYPFSRGSSRTQESNQGLLHADSIPFRPQWPGLLPHPWSLSRLGSLGWPALGLRDVGRMSASEPCSMDLACLLPSAPAHQILVGPPADYTYCTQRIWSLWAGRALESPLGSMSPGDGVPTSSFLPSVSPPMMKAPSRVVLQEFQGIGVRKEEGMGHKSWVFLLAHSTLNNNPGTQLSGRLRFPP